MRQKIQEVQDYFADKIARGLYKVVVIDEYASTVIIDRKYKFSLWYCNGIKFFKTYPGRDNFMELEFNDVQIKKAYKKTMLHVKKWEETEVKDKELKELENLRAKYPDAK